MTEQARRIYAGVGDDQSAAVGLPREAYVDAAVFESETQHVLRAGWLPVARTSTVANPGDYHSVDLLGVPLVVSRDTDGALHVLSRVCRHRGMPVVEGDGNRKDFSCPYHLWRYGLDGRFLFAPAMDRSASFDASKCNLTPVAHEEWGGWVFVNLSGDAKPLAPSLRRLQQRIEGLTVTVRKQVVTIDLQAVYSARALRPAFHCDFRTLVYGSGRKRSLRRRRSSSTRRGTGK